MLIVCPECSQQVSDKAVTCPHCGYPLQQPVKAPRSRKPNRRRRLPNGFGQITEIKGRNLQKPFRVMITTGKTDEGRPICKPLKPHAYFATYNEAYTALLEYNKDPYELDSLITMEELYERWYRDKVESKLSVSRQNTIKAAWNYCSSIYKVMVRDVRVSHVKYCIENGIVIRNGIEKHLSPAMKIETKTLLGQMLDYAVEWGLVDKNYARSFKLDSDVSKESLAVRKEHITFTDKEMESLWAHVSDVKYVDVVLIQCYSGWRPQEIGLLKLDDVDLNAWTFKGGIKTNAGKDRIVPIHSRIRELVVKRYEEAKSLGSEFLINYTTCKKRTDMVLTYSRYNLAFRDICKKLGLNLEHRPHDGRKQFVTMAKNCGVDEYAIKHLIGHSIQDITEKIYTVRDAGWLSQEIEKIK